MHKKSKSGRYIASAVLFIVFVVGIVVVTMLVKVISHLSQSKFDTAHQFILAAGEINPTLFVIDPDTNSLVQVRINGVKESDVGLKLFIPIDSLNIRSFDASTQTASSYFQHLVFSGGISNLTILDRVRLWWFVKGLKSDAITKVDRSSLGTTLIDKSLYQEAKTIAIINASGVVGLGNRFAKLLTTLGGNVISVTTADQLAEKTSVVSYTSVGYTESRLERILQVKTQVVTAISPQLSAITVTLGKDMGDTKSF